MNTKRILSLVLSLAGLSLLDHAALLRAAQTTIYKLNTSTMNAAGDWSLSSGGSPGSSAPGAGDIGTFDTNSASTPFLGGNVTLDELAFAATAPAVTISNSASATLTLGTATAGYASGIDMSAATANVTLNCATKFNQSCTLKVASGLTLAITNASLALGSGTTTTFVGADNTAVCALTFSGVSGFLTAGTTWNVTNGLMTSLSGRNFKSNLTIQGGKMVIIGGTSGTLNADRLSFETASQTFNMTAGELDILTNVPSNTQTYGFRIGSPNGAAGASTAGNVTATQSGGTVNVYDNKSGSGVLTIGGTNASSYAYSYTLSGSGILNLIGIGSDGTLLIGADTNGLCTSTFSLQGGKLTVTGTTTTSGITGSQGTTNGSPKQVFNWTGGTLVCGAYNGTNLQSTAGGAYGTLANGGGTLAPGDIGYSGKTIITGSYSANASSVLAIDIGGTNASSAFQDPANTNKFDLVAISGTAALGGSLNVSLINGTNGSTFMPANTNTFKILTTAANGVSGSFANMYNGRVTVANTSGSSLTVAYNNADVTLGNYAALAANWTVQNASAPAGSTVTFTDNGSVGAITNWIVNFGDGSANYTNSVSAGSAGGALSGVNTTHVYAGGAYTATLTVVASDGSTATKTQAITASSNPTLAWLGTASTNWNTSDLDWTNLTAGGVSTAYADGDPVIFNEGGSAQPSVNLAATVQPASVNFSNSVTTYTLQGVGKISGTASLVKALAGTTIILTTNDFSGGTTIAGGTLQLGNGTTANGALGGGAIGDNAALALDPASPLNFTNSISGSGSLSLQNSSITLAAGNSYNGGTAIGGGATAVISADNNLGASGSALTFNNGTLQVTASSALALSHPLTVNAGGGTLNLASGLISTQSNTGGGTLSVSAGTFQIGAAGTAGSVAGNIALTGGNLTYSRTDTIAPAGSISGNSAGSSITNLSTAAANTNTLTLADGTNLFATIKNAAAGSLVLTGSANSTNLLAGTGSGSGLVNAGAALWVNGGSYFLTNATLNAGGAGGGTLVINGGTVSCDYSNASGSQSGAYGFPGNLAIRSGALNVNVGRLNFPNNSQSLTISGGALNLTNAIGGAFYGLRMGSTGGNGNANDANSQNFTGIQTGGSVYIGNFQAELGGLGTSKVASYTLSGGTFTVATPGSYGLYLGADTGGTSTTTFTLTNNAKLSIAGTIGGGSGNTNTSVAVFALQGGTLVAGAYNASTLRDAAADPVGTLVNNNATIAPGDLGTPGKMSVTGNFTVNSGNLAIDIGGTNQANAFQNGPTNYDYVAVSGNATLGGSLSINLVDGFVPSPNDSYVILTTGGTLGGGFTNLIGGNSVVVANDASYVFNVLTTTNAVILTGFAPLSPVVSFAAPGTNVVYGSPVTLSVTTTGVSPVGYQWYDINTNPIAGANGTGLNLGVPAVSASGNYTLVATNAYGASTNQIALTVSPATLTVSAQSQMINYGMPVPATTVAYSGFVNGDTAASLTTLPTISSAQSGVLPAGLYAGNYAAAGASDPNYSINYVASDLNVQPVPLTITAQPQTIIYGATVPATTVGYNGFVNGDSASSLTTQPTLTSAQSGVPAAGTYAANYTATGATDPNYNISYEPGTLTVSPATLTVTADSFTQVYGSTNPILTASFSGFVNGDSSSVVSGSPDLGTAVTTNTPVGVYPITIEDNGTLSAANYTFNDVNGSLTVTQAVLTVTANDTNRAYGAANPVFTATITGLVNGESATDTNVLTGAADLATTADATSPIGSYDITAALGSLAATNYSFVFSNGTLSVVTAQLTGLAGVSDKTYDGTTNATIASLSLSGVVNGDDVSLTGGEAAFADKNVGLAKTVTVTGLSLTGSQATNYALVSSVVLTNASINPATLTVTATGVDKTYDATTTATVTLGDNRITGDNLTDSYASASFSDANAGTAKTVTVSGITISGTDAGNYQLASDTTTATADITPLALTVTAVADTKTYDTTTASAGIPTFSPALAGADTAGFTQTFDTPNVGLGKPLTPAGVVNDGNGGNNYSYTYVQVATGEIDPASLTITADSTNKVYGQSLAFAGTEFTSSGLLPGDSITTVQLSSDGTAITAPVNAYPIVITNATGSGLGNYAITYVDGTLTVTAAPTNQITSIIANRDGSRTVTFTGVTGYSYRVQVTTNLSAPVWVDLSTNTIVGGTSSCTDTNTAGMPFKFYRTVYP